MNRVLNLFTCYQNSYLPIKQPSIDSLTLLKLMSKSLMMDFLEFSKQKIAQSSLQLNILEREKSFSKVETLELRSMEKKQKENQRTKTQVEGVEKTNKQKKTVESQEKFPKQSFETRSGSSSIKKLTADLKPQKKGKFICKEPKTDIAHFSSRKLSYAALLLKKQKLLKRKVDTWGKVLKKGKDQGNGIHKREVRMLFK